MGAVPIVATIATPQFDGELARLAKMVSWVQLRADLVGDIPMQWLRAHFPGKLIYTLRTGRAEGKFDGSLEERRRRLVQAAHSYDLLELESCSDLSPDLLAVIPAHKRMISWYGPAIGVSALQVKFQQIATVPARYYCIVISAKRSCDGLQPLQLLQSLMRKDVAAFCEGAVALWSRLLSPYFGSSLLFAHLNDPASGEINVQRLITDYGFPALRTVKKLYGMVGNQILQSPSPRLHNAGYRELDHPGMFVPFHVENFQDFWSAIATDPTLDSLGIPIHGLVTVSPYKEAAVAVAGTASPMARRIGAGNVVVRSNNAWRAETTDPESIAGIRRNHRLRAAVIGCGGAGRAVAATLQQAGAEVTLVNRGQERGAYAVQLLGLPFVPLSEFRAENFNLIVNATPLGRNGENLPFAIDGLRNGAQIVDLAYGAHPTPLVSTIQARGGVVIDGHDVLLTQVRKQFQLMTGIEMPATIGRDTVLDTDAHGFMPAETRAPAA